MPLPKRRIRLRHIEKNKTGVKKEQAAKVKKTRRPVHTAAGELNEIAAAEFLNKSVQTLRNRRSLGKPPKFKRVGRSVYYMLSDLEDFRTAITRNGTIISE
ncbi:hypothetical protein SAMN05421665_1462 [Yoonia rosea]|uniref:Helix-turn-helix domain-containing protein n=1 Tax=Yoonia rosea TaxID=287098 RepID=A0A1R3WWK9_9RHOB|nr:hypothetical protein [Yoonia rosea]SIT82446.1 hypothetical protein SAMN05421665_1462 [Yoonia rosea]